jgi:hypothetical protein
MKWLRASFRRCSRFRINPSFVSEQLSSAGVPEAADAAPPVMERRREARGKK